jgi:hypothetical protein
MKKFKQSGLSQLSYRLPVNKVPSFIFNDKKWYLWSFAKFKNLTTYFYETS